MDAINKTKVLETDQRIDVSVKQDGQNKPNPTSKNLWQNNKYYSQDKKQRPNYSKLKTDNDNDEFLKISESFLSHFIGLSDPNA